MKPFLIRKRITVQVKSRRRVVRPSLPELLARFDHVVPDYLQARFKPEAPATPGRNPVSWPPILFRIREKMTTKQVLQRIERSRLRPAGLGALASYRPRFRHEGELVALGDVADFIGNHFVPCLTVYQGRSILAFRWRDAVWHPCTIFLCIPF